MKPGEGAKLGLGAADFANPDESFLEIFVRMVPENPFAAFSDNSKMLQVILIISRCQTARRLAPVAARLASIQTVTMQPVSPADQ